MSIMKRALYAKRTSKRATCGADQPRSAFASSAPAGVKGLLNSPANPLPTTPNGAEIPLPASLPYHDQDIDIRHISKLRGACFEDWEGVFPCRQGDAVAMAAITASLVKMACAKLGPLTLCAACIASGLNAAVASRTKVT
jgi:hypothetical protein